MQDLGVASSLESTSVQPTTSDFPCCTYAIPAKANPVIIRARPTKISVSISHTLTFVYSRFYLHISEELKPRNHSLPTEQQLAAAEFGGKILFPSGQLTAFLLDKEGFIGKGKEYVLFLWKPIRSDDTYVISQAYLIQNRLVCPVSASAPNARLYAKMPLSDFLIKVKTAIAKNVDTD